MGQKALTHYFPAGQADAGTLIQEYLKPIGEDLGTLATNGWYNTAATHKRFGFDISATMSMVSIPDARKSFAEPNLANNTFTGSLNDKIPTVYGDAKNYPGFTLTGGPNVNHRYLGPDGIDPTKTYKVNGQPLPTLQLGLGLFANTDIRIRFMPTIKPGDTKVGSIGGAIMHDIKQHIPGLKMVPFSMSILIGYTQVTSTTDLSGNYTGSAQEAKSTSTATNIQLLLSKSFSVVTFYGGLGYASASTKFNVNGTYNVNSAGTGDTFTGTTWTPYTLTNPYSYTFKNSGFKANIGMRLKLGPVFLHGGYGVLGKQNPITAGFGFTFR
jgi:hypothetical protein